MSEIHKLTSYSDGFGIFNKIAEHEFDVNNKNYLRLFMLNTENKLFNYDELYEYLLPNIARYVFDRKKLAEAEKDPVKQSLILIEAINHLRKITSDKDRGSGGELGEVLLYLFLEQDFRAPKLFSKVELKTSKDIDRDSFLQVQYERLLVEYTRSLFGTIDTVFDDRYRSLLCYADLLSISELEVHNNLAQQIVILLSRLLSSCGNTL